jgi:uncharacterized cupin superfamily protein
MTVSGIKLEHNPSTKKLEQMGVRDWPVWTKEASTFPWTYDSEETCYFLEGDVMVTRMGARRCTWVLAIW